MSHIANGQTTDVIDYSAHKLDINRFGFWVYIMTDCILFSTVFATYAVLHNNTAGGPGAKDLFSLSLVLLETLILLTSSFTIGLAMLAVRKNSLRQAFGWLATTFLLGASFLSIELFEFRHLVTEGHGWSTSAFLSAYFTLVGLHGAHILVGLLWLAIMMLRLKRRGISPKDNNNLAMLGIFWHFLDIIWIFIFSFVYLIGVGASV